MKKNKKKSTRLKYISSSILMLIMAFLLAITSTLAWLTMTISSSVSGMWFEVSTYDNLLAAVKQWKYREITATKQTALRHELTKDGQSGEYIYEFNQTQRFASSTNIQNLDNKYYVYTLSDGTEIDYALVTTENQEYFVYTVDGELIDVSLFESSKKTDGNEYVLMGHFLEEPEYADYTNDITESQIAKVCMNSRFASKVTDVLTNATTLNNENGFAESITNLVGLNGRPYQTNSLAGGSRFTVSVPTMPETTVYKYEFDIYFVSDNNLKIALNTRASSVRSDISSNEKYTVKAWRDIVLDNHTTDINLKNYYQTTYGLSDVVPVGAKIATEIKNAVRIGFSASNGTPISIWDPNHTYGWTKNEQTNNLALEYYNLMMTDGGDSVLKGEPAKAHLTSTTLLISSMSQADNGKYYGSIKITVWLEGFDADCFDSLLSESMSLKLDFIAQPVEE